MSRRSQGKSVYDNITVLVERQIKIQWCKECLSCKSANVEVQTKKSIKYLPIPFQLSTNVQMYIVSPQKQPEVPAPYKSNYFLTIINVVTRWQEVIPMPEISSLTFAIPLHLPG